MRPSSVLCIACLVSISPICVLADTVYVETVWRAAPSIHTMNPKTVTLRLTGPDTIAAGVPFDLTLEVLPEQYESGQVGIGSDMTAMLLYDDELTSVSYVPLQDAYYDGSFREMPLIDFWEASDQTSRLRIDEILALRTQLETFTQSGSFIWKRYTRTISDSEKRYYVMDFIDTYDSFSLPVRGPSDGSLSSALRYKIPLTMEDLSSLVCVVFTEFELSMDGCFWNFPRLTLVLNPASSANSRLQPPDLQSPPDSSYNPDRPMRLSWTQVDDEAQYMFWCSFGGELFTYHLGQSPFWVIAQWYWADIPDGTYFWWATAENDHCQSEQSEMWTFTKYGRGDENLPEQLEPEQGVINPERPFAIRWSEVPGVPTYTLRVQIPGQSAHTHIDVNGTELVIDQALWDSLDEGAVYWQVKPATGYALASYGDRWSFIKRPADCTNDIDMVPIPAGTFEMGSPADEFGRDSTEGPIHTVSISAFEISSTPITRRQWLDTMGWLDDGGYWESEHHPVDSVCWFDAVAFCNALSEAEGLTKCYTMTDVRYDFQQHHIGHAEVTCDWEANGYRLPTEAEWEYACRAGTTTRFHSGDTVFDLDRVGWYLCNSGTRTHPVAEKEPNAFGLYDMHGQAWEWCWDWLGYNYYAASPVQDPRGPDDGYNGNFTRVHRGGARARRAWNCRSAKRYSHTPDRRGSYIIFRIARSAR